MMWVVKSLCRGQRVVFLFLSSLHDFDTELYIIKIVVTAAIEQMPTYKVITSTCR